jgi:hypothetical protein
MTLAISISFCPQRRSVAIPHPFGLVAMTLIFFFLGFLASRLLLCWPLAMSISFGLRMTLGDGVFFVWVTHQFNTTTSMG